MAAGYSRRVRGSALRLLLDIHVLLWALGDEDRLGPAARDLLTEPANEILFSIVSLWEIAVKARTGKLRADHVRVAAEARATGFSFLGLSEPHLAALTPLPMHHRDPFDHLLIAQAIVERATLVSDDEKFALYPVGVTSPG